MKKLGKILIILLLLGIVGVGIYFGYKYLQPVGAGVYIETNPVSQVFIDGEQVGRTPYEEVRNEGDIGVRLVPESLENPLAPFETNMRLVSGVETIVRYDFAQAENMAAGEVVSFEKVGKDETSVSIITIPDSAQILIDGRIMGFSPYKTEVVQGEHEIRITLPGFTERAFTVNAVSGHKLTAQVWLADDGVEEEPEEEEVQKVKILSTPTGFLRVREEPSVSGTELARVEPDEEYVLVEEDEETGWVKIEYAGPEEGLPTPTGWVSGEYVEKVTTVDTEG